MCAFQIGCWPPWTVPFTGATFAAAGAVGDATGSSVAISDTEHPAIKSVELARNNQATLMGRKLRSLVNSPRNNNLRRGLSVENLVCRLAPCTLSGNRKQAPGSCKLTVSVPAFPGRPARQAKRFSGLRSAGHLPFGQLLPSFGGFTLNL